MTTSNPKHILIADDDLDLRTMLAMTLREEGYRVSHAVNGKEAIELHRSTPFDLVITELGLNGFEALVEMRRHHPPVKFITTSNTIRVPVELCQRMGEYLGAQCFIAKPFTSKRLLAEVQRALD